MNITLVASGPVSATILLIPLAIASSLEITKSPIWPDRCRWLLTEKKSIRD